jgi:hypothetical protein
LRQPNQMRHGLRDIIHSLSYSCPFRHLNQRGQRGNATPDKSE